MNDLLKDAIADAKAVRETALANAKVALEEAFTPRLQSMLSAKLSEEEGDEVEMDIDVPEEPAMDMPMETDNDDMMPEGDYKDETNEDMDPEKPADEMMPEMAHDDEGMTKEDMDEKDPNEALELESLIAELEADLETEELDSSDIGSTDGVSDDASETHTEDPGEGELTVEEDDKEMKTKDDEKKIDEDISLDEIISALTEEEGDDKEDKVKEEDEKSMTKEEEDKKDLKEAYTVIKFLKSKINEVNLLNAKLLFSNKLFRNYPLNESQKMKVIENFDRASNLREVKLIFTTLSESFVATKTKRSIKESYASKPSRSTAPKKEILSEGNQLAARWKKLANLK